MGLTDKLANPTPFDVEIEYQAGIPLVIPADGQISLTMEQLDNFHPHAPGHEAIRNILDFYGVFLVDSDVSYDRQALRALKASRSEKNKNFQNFVSRLRDAVFAGQNVDQDTIDGAVEKGGYGRLKREIEILDARISKLEEALGSSEGTSTTRKTFDPKLTCFGTNPPREFLSELSLQMFLDEHPELLDTHNEIKEQILNG